MDVSVWSDNDEESFAVDAQVDVNLLTYQLGGAVAAGQKIVLPSRQQNWFAVIDGSTLEVVVSDRGDPAVDQKRGIPQPPPPAQGPNNPAGVHVTPMAAGKILYVSVATPRSRTSRSGSGSDDPPNPAGTH